jgi:hypothetical protein
MLRPARRRPVLSIGGDVSIKAKLLSHSTTRLLL